MAIVLGFISFLIAFACAVTVGPLLSLLYGWNIYMVGAGAFLGVYLSVSAVIGLVFGLLQLSGGGLGTNSIVRWMVGKFAWCALFATVLLVLHLALSFAGMGLINVLAIPFFALTSPFAFLAQFWSVPFLAKGYILMLLLLPFAMFGAVESLRVFIARATIPLRYLWRSLKSGFGGSAKFIGLLDEWLMRHRPGQIMLGTSLYEPGRRLGVTDDRHMITIATNRAGKGRSAIIPNLLLYPGSAIVIDPKGENAAVTAPARRRMGQSVYILDPFQLLKNGGASPHDYPTHRFNPLDALDPDSLEIFENMGQLAEALIVRAENAGSGVFFDNSAKIVLTGIIAHVLSWKGLKDKDRHLGTVRDYVVGTNGRSFVKDANAAVTAGNPSPGNAAATALETLGQGADDTGGDIRLTLSVHTAWLDSVAMRAALSGSDFRLADLKGGNATLYLILPQQLVGEHVRFLRLFITLALQAAAGVKARHAMLFVLDEFALLGPLRVLQQAAGIAAGSGIKLWPFLQSIVQLRMYGEEWEVFLSQAGVIQVFAMNDKSTAEYFSGMLGQHIAWRRRRVRATEFEWEPHGATFLRTSAELARESSRDSGRALLFFEGGKTALVHRANYDAMFAPGDYDINPMERDKFKGGRLYELRRRFAFFKRLEPEDYRDHAAEWLRCRRTGELYDPEAYQRAMESDLSDQIHGRGQYARPSPEPQPAEEPAPDQGPIPEAEEQTVDPPPIKPEKKRRPQKPKAASAGEDDPLKQWQKDWEKAQDDFSKPRKPGL